MITKKKESPRTSDYKTFLFKRLRDPKLAAGYLTASLQEGKGAFLIAIRDVAEAQGGISSLAKATALNREGLYDMLSENGNPRLSSLSTLLDALGLRVEFAAKPSTRRVRLQKT